MRNLSLVVIFAAVLAIAGCGGDDDTTTTTVSTGASGATGGSGSNGGNRLSQEEFVSQANSICADVNDQITALKPPSHDVQSVGEFATQGLAIVTPALSQLASLVPPAELQGQFDKWTSGLQTQIGLDEQLAIAAQAGEAQTVNDLIKQLQANNDKVDQLATDMGLTECAKDAAPQG